MLKDPALGSIFVSEVRVLWQARWHYRIHFKNNGDRQREIGYSHGFGRYVRRSSPHFTNKYFRFSARTGQYFAYFLRNSDDHVYSFAVFGRVTRIISPQVNPNIAVINCSR
jgi:hypothetical protein